MTIQEMQGKIDKLNYWDTKVTGVTANYYGDELEIRLEKTRDVKDDVITFMGCYDIHLHHVWNYSKFKLLREYSYPQLGFYAQNILFSGIRKEAIDFYQCDLNLFPLYIKVIFKDITFDTLPPIKL